MKLTTYYPLRHLAIPCRLIALMGLSLLMRASATAQQPIQPVVRLVSASQPEVVPTPAPQPLPPCDPGLTLAQLEQMALLSNPSIARSAAIVGAARGTWVQAGLGPNPSVGYEGQQLGSGGLAEQQGVLISQEIIRGRKLGLNRAVADREVAVAQQELAAQQLRVLTDVRIAFYQVLLAQRQIDMTQHLIRISNEGAQAAENLHRSKEVPRTDVLQSQLEVENTQILAENARNRHDAAWRSLAAVAGNPLLPAQPLLGDASAPPLELRYEEVLARIKATSPEVSAALFEISRSQAALNRARAEPIPNVNLQGLINAQDNGIGGKPDAGLAVTMAIPLFNRNQGAIQRAQSEIAAAKSALIQIELDLQNRLAPTYEQYANARNQVVRYRDKILPAAQESLDLTRKTYEAGELNYVGLLAVQRTFAYTHLNYLEALRSLRVAEVEIEGLLLRGSLQRQPVGQAPLEPSGAYRTAPIGGVELFR